MPIYEYRCHNGHSFEVFQSMSEDPVSTCEECGAPVERVLHPVAVHFKGSGFYTTDYARKGAAKSGGDGSSSASEGGSGSSSASEDGSGGSSASEDGSGGSSDSGSGSKSKSKSDSGKQKAEAGSS